MESNPRPHRKAKDLVLDNPAISQSPKQAVAQAFNFGQSKVWQRTKATVATVPAKNKNVKSSKQPLFASDSEDSEEAQTWRQSKKACKSAINIESEPESDASMSKSAEDSESETEP
ncbi:hypothetical protein F4604DRAFT_1933423 [Suillus subluteus]|nr:hypothetical protein F4604DRAFT_1933423 [Suillus subluteus]